MRPISLQPGMKSGLMAASSIGSGHYHRTENAANL
jgi:hypothetical protein